MTPPYLHVAGEGGGGGTNLHVGVEDGDGAKKYDIIMTFYDIIMTFYDIIMTLL